MKLVKELESRVVISKTGIKKTRKYGIFLCPVCNKEVERALDNGKKTVTCGKGCKDNGCTTHGKSNTSLYNIWRNMKARCDNPKDSAYKFYGAKGISYPNEWKTFDGFLADMEEGYIPGLSIDRIDVKKSYSKDNCQWIELTENISKDKLKVIAKYTLEGHLLKIYPSVKAAAEAEGIKYAHSIGRVARGDRSQYKGFVWKYVN